MSFIKKESAKNALSFFFQIKFPRPASDMNLNSSPHLIFPFLASTYSVNQSQQDGTQKSDKTAKNHRTSQKKRDINYDVSLID